MANNNLTALFKESIAEFCSLQEALYYILLGIVPFGNTKGFIQNVNKVLILKYNFPNNPYLQDDNSNTNSETIKSDISDSITTECDNYCIEVEKLCLKQWRKIILMEEYDRYHNFKNTV